MPEPTSEQKPTPEIVSVEKFWKLVAASKLIDPGMLESLRREFQGLPSQPGRAAEPSQSAATAVVAKRLVDRGVLSLWQAKRLARGERGPYFIDDYRLIDRLEYDGRGLLFQARHDPSGREVRLVLLSKSLCNQIEVWTSIVQQTTIAHQAKNSMLSRTWALEQSQGQRFIVCEQIEGMPLADELARFGAFQSGPAGTLILAIAQAVAELHRLGTVHGAISLDTLLREPPKDDEDPRSGSVRLLQFPQGVDPHQVTRSVLFDTQERVSQLGRRASFIAPELMVPGGVCDARSDVYALGCVFHSLLTGLLPCWLKTPKHTLAQAALLGPAPLGPPRVPAPVAALISCMVARDPAARHATAQEAAAAIAECFGLADISAGDVLGGPSKNTPAMRLSPALPQAAPSQFSAPEIAPAVAIVKGAADFTGVETLATPRMLSGAGNPPGLFDLAIQKGTLAARRRAARLRLIGMSIVGVVSVVSIAAILFWSAPAFDSKSKGKSLASKKKSAVDSPPAGDTKPPTPAPEKPVVGAISDPPPPAPKPPAGEKSVAQPVLVSDPDLPWASPTAGLPPNLEYLPPGSQLILLARPADIHNDPEGLLFVRSLGPRVEEAIKKLTGICGCELSGIEVLQAGWQADGRDQVVGGFMFRLTAPIPTPIDPASWKNAWGDTKEVTLKSETIYKGETLSYWLPSAEQGQVLVVAGESILKEMVESGREADRSDTIKASLPLDLEVLVGMLDRKRHLTLFGSPTYLLNDGRAVMAGSLVKLVEPLGDFFLTGKASASKTTSPKVAAAAALSLHCGQNFYIEIDTIATLDEPAKVLAKTLAERVAALADTIETYCAHLNPHAYGRKLVLRLPAMMRVLSANARSGAEGKGVVLNGYLPQHAGHNLVLAAELALEQSGGAANETVAGSTPAKNGGDGSGAAQGALAKLQKKITLTFNRDNLERSIQMLAEETGVPMEIMGSDLQLEGITKNQSFGLDEKDQTADAILKIILARSNTDGKLVYVVRTKGGIESIEITTRAAVAKRGDKLPPGFEKAKTEEKPKETQK